MNEDDYSDLFVPSFHTRYVYPPPEFVPPQPQVIIPQMGAAKYWYVDPRATNFNPAQPRPVNTEGIGLLPAGTMNILLRNVLGRSPRLADNELNDMLNSSPETQFLGKPQPTPTPTPRPRTGASYAV